MYKDDKLENFVIDLAIQASKKSKFHPVDREFLETRLKEILSYDACQFIYYNLELENDLYSIQLFACLPEIWEKVTVDQILEISTHFTNVRSLYTLTRFMYKYIEVDIIESILNSPIIQCSPYFKSQLLEYLQLQWSVFIKTESDFEDFENGFIDVDYNKWMYIKQRFLLNSRVKPALTNIELTHNYFNTLARRYRN